MERQAENSRKPSRKFLFSVILFLLVVFGVEFGAGILLERYPIIERMRECLSGEQQFETDLNSVSQAYLLYIPKPNYVTPGKGIQQNNADGYRGERVPLQRTPNSIRILFLGGSTTYGEGVLHPEDSYPAQLGKMLRQDARFSGKKIEIINAGLRFGTTAEILTHYALKFRYYKPDVVVINPGGNDPVAYVTDKYQPDYSNWRKQPPMLYPLKSYARWILKSRAASIAVVLLFFPDYVVGTSFTHGGEAMPAEWFSPREKDRLHLDELAFYNNLAAVIREIKANNSSVVLLSYQGNPYDKGDQKTYRRLYDFEESVLAVLGKEFAVPYLPYPLDRMPANLWVDPSHINEEGTRRKAEYVFPVVVDEILKRGETQYSNTPPPSNLPSEPVLDLPPWNERYRSSE